MRRFFSFGEYREIAMKLIEIFKRFDITSEQEEFDTIHETVEKGVQFRGTNLWILIFAIIIASVGLNVNSTAVIIGAMLISPLMGPILGMGYSLAVYDLPLLRRSVVNFGFAVLASLVASSIYFYLTPLGQAHSELLARTQPNIYDVIIALVGGLAGIVAISSKNKGNVITGVAIATALMPPLCTAGYGLATGQWNFFFGAFYLFTINTVFIAAATVYTVRLLKFPIWSTADEAFKKRIDNWVSAIVIATAVPSIYFGYRLVQQEQFSNAAASFIRNESYIEGDYLLRSDVNAREKSIRLIYGGRHIPDSVKSALVARAPDYAIDGAEIVIQQGFSIEDQNRLSSMSKITDERGEEIKRLQSLLARHLANEDSLRKKNEMGGQILQELKPLFPEITGCGVSELIVFEGSNRRHRYLSLSIKSSSLRRTSAQTEKITRWFQSRSGRDSVKVYID